MTATTLAVELAPLADIVEAVTSAYLGIDAAPISREVHDAADPDSAWSACVMISGAWDGTLVLTCGDAFVSRAARAMFGLDSRAVSHGDATDALGEIANMIGGNFKALIAGDIGAPCRLSIPVVTRASLELPAARLLHRVTFDCAGNPLTVSIHAEGARARRALQ